MHRAAARATPGGLLAASGERTYCGQQASSSAASAAAARAESSRCPTRRAVRSDEAEKEPRGVQNIPGGAGRPTGRVHPRPGSSGGDQRGVRGGTCCVGTPQLAGASSGRAGGSRRVAPADCGLGLRARGGGGVNAAADRHVTSWCEDRGARAKRLGGDSIRAPSACSGIFCSVKL